MSADGQQPHILCINHSAEVLDLLHDLLEDEGFSVTIQSHVDKDLDAIVDLAPDVITLDYMWTSLDQDWSFLELLKLDPRTSTIPIVLCTGAVREVEALAEHLKRMQVLVVLKPFDIEQFVRAVHNALGHEVAAEYIPGSDM